MTIIHYFNLDDLIREVAPEYDVVRMESTTRAIPYDTPGLALQVWEVHVRVHAEGSTRIGVWMTRIGQMQTLHGKPLGSDTGKRSELAERAEAVKDAIREYLHQHDITARPGLVEIGNAKLAIGYWDGLEDLLPSGESEGPNDG